MHHCKHCGKYTNRWKYCEECALVVEKIKNRERCKRFRKRHGSERVTKWQREHPEKRKQHIRTYMKKHREKLCEYNRNYRKKHPDWWKAQIQKSNQKRKERRNMYGFCYKCGSKAIMSSREKLCNYCLFKKSYAKYQKRQRELLQKGKKPIKERYIHLLPPLFDKKWEDEFIDIQRMKIRNGLINTNGEKVIWTNKHIMNIFNKYRQMEVDKMEEFRC